MNPTTTSDYYLERVGFEAKVNFRHNLKTGSNIIGRSDTVGVDIGINSFLCSRKHCVVSVSEDLISVEDLNSSNGTTINSLKLKGEKALVKENDLIGIVGGANALSQLIGNHNFIVYRLRKYTSDNIQTFEIEDDDPIELSDNEDENIICLDSDGESVDVKEEDDLDIQLSRNFNIEIKKELIDFEEDWEALTLHVKRERVELTSDAIDQDLYETSESSNQTEETSLHKVPVENYDSDNDSVDSNQTVCFPVIPEQDNNNDLHCDGNKTVPLSDQTNVDTKKFEQKLQDTVSKINESEKKKKKRCPEMIYAKPLEKRRKRKREDSPQRLKQKPEANSGRKERLKAAASTSPKLDKPKQTTAHTTPKVKFTPNNRGSFLTDMAQTPVLPKDLPQRKKQEKPCEVKRSPLKVVPNILDDIPTPPELDQKIWENMHSRDASQVPEALRLSPTKQRDITNGDSSKVLEVTGMENEDSSTCTTCDTDSLSNGGEGEIDQLLDFNDDDVEMDTEENVGNENDDDDGDDSYDDALLIEVLMKQPPETDTITIVETFPKPTRLKSILKISTLKSTDLATKKKRRVTFKDTGFQFDPRHKIISDLTAYDCSQFETVEAFCRSVDTNISSFADSYEDYKEYRRTLVSLSLVELWKEIEMEYVNSKIHSLTTVTINDQNLEKRGEGRRMVFHCQADTLYKSQSICDGHLVFATCRRDEKDIEFIALITSISYSKKNPNEKLAYFTMETSILTEVLPIVSLNIRPITVITNTLNSLNAIYNLKRSPLRNLVINPLSEENLAPHTPENITLKCYDPLDDTQRRILNSLYRRCINLDVPNISLLEGAAGTGKTCMIVNLALQLVYGDELPKPLKILICSKSNGSINDLTRKLIRIRDDTSGSTKIQLVRFGMLENMDRDVQRVSVQHLKDIELHSPQFSSYEDLVSQKTTLELKIAALQLDNDVDHSTNLKLLQKQLYKVNALLDRFDGLEKKKLRDAATFILNSCDIICTTLASIPMLQNYVSKVDVCIIDEATQCSEPLTLLPFQFGMPSLVLVGDSQLVPLAAFSPAVKARNFGNSLFARFQKLLLGKFGSPVFEMNFQYRIQQEILIWPNHQFYKNRLVPHATVKDDSFPIAPYKIISYSLENGAKDSDNIMLVVKVLLGHVDWHTHSIGMICTNYKQNSVLKNKLRDYPNIATNTAESYIGEKDVVIIWISEEHGISHLAHQQILNAAVTRAKKSLLICGANLTAYKNRPVWRSLLENANRRKCMQHFKALSAPKICNTLSRNILEPGPRPKCNICKF